MSVEYDGQRGGAYASLTAWQAELASLDPRSHAYQELSSVLASLAGEAGMSLPELQPEPAQAEVPPAFIAAVPLGDVVEVPADQFRLIPALYRRRRTYTVTGTELLTDDGRRVHLVDLRPELAGRLEDVAPTVDEAARLDSHFYHDLRLLVERGLARNVVRRNGGNGAGPCYTRVIGAKSRAFWGPVRVVEQTGEHVMTVARMADCGNDPQKEIALYRRVFGITMRGIK